MSSVTSTRRVANHLIRNAAPDFHVCFDRCRGWKEAGMEPPSHNPRHACGRPPPKALQEPVLPALWEARVAERHATPVCVFATHEARTACIIHHPCVYNREARRRLLS